MICPRCGGKGFIEGFSHVNQGRCFSCNGSGSLPDTKKHTKAYAQAFIDQYGDRVQQESGADCFFPKYAIENATKLYSVYGEGETWEFAVMKDETHYYVGQPVCRSSVWWKVPIDQWIDFVKYIFKAKKIELH